MKKLIQLTFIIIIFIFSLCYLGASNENITENKNDIKNSLINTASKNNGFNVENIENRDVYEYVYDTQVQGSITYTLRNKEYTKNASYVKIKSLTYNNNDKVGVYVYFEDTSFNLTIWLSYVNNEWKVSNFNNKKQYFFSVLTKDEGVESSSSGLGPRDFNFNFESENSSYGEIKELSISSSQTRELDGWEGRYEKINSFDVDVYFDTAGYITKGNYYSNYHIDDVRYMNTLPVIRNVPEKIQQNVFFNPDKYLEDLVDYLIQGESDVLVKTKIIHDWIADNIFYDFDALYSGAKCDVSYQGTLINRKSVCEGYSNLFDTMCDYAGIDVAKIIGMGKGFGQQISHAWNAIRVNEKWYIIDVTWDSQNAYENKTFVRKFFRTSYLFLEPKYAVYDHLPDKELYQFLDNPISKSKFNSLPEEKKVSCVYNAFHENNFKLVNPLPAVIEMNGEPIEIQFEGPEDLTISAIAINTNKQYFTQYCFIQKKGDVYSLSINPSKKGEYLIDIGIVENQTPLFSVGIEVKTNSNTDHPFPNRYDEFMKKNMFLYSPVQGELSLNKTYDFKIYAPNIDNIYLVTPSNEFTKMNKDSGNIYYINDYEVTESGSLYIVGEDGGQYPGLIMYVVN